jgi:hypothetical protein
MNLKPREAVWILLSALFVDAEHAKEDLRAIGTSLRETGFSADEVEAILRREVAPVCGQWMTYPGASGPWPVFEAEELMTRIGRHVCKPWYKPPFFSTGLMFMPGVKRDWATVRSSMRDEPM